MNASTCVVSHPVECDLVRIRATEVMSGSRPESRCDGGGVGGGGEGGDGDGGGSEWASRGKQCAKRSEMTHWALRRESSMSMDS